MATATETESATNKSKTNTMANILIADDEKSIRKTLREILEYESYKVDEAVDGSQAFEMLRDGDYDCALLDIKMPKMDGIEVLTKLQGTVCLLKFSDTLFDG